MKSFLLSSLLFVGSLNAQGLPQQVPPVAPPPPPINNAGANPANPQVNPGAPPQQPPATPQYGPPAQQPPAYTPYGQQPAGVNPYNPYQQPVPGFGAPIQLDPQNLDCEFNQCRNRRITLSPGQGFHLNCQIPMQCNGLDLTLNVGFDPTNPGSNVNEINGLNFDAPQNGVTIRINSFGGNNVEVNNVYCKTFGACQNLKIIGGFGVETHNINFHCEVPGACTGCTVNGLSCSMFSMMTGNNNGNVGYGYGYTNTANVPPPQYGNPQQPQYGAPQQPQGPPVYPGVQQPQQPQLPQYPAPPMPQQGYPQYPQWI